MITCAIAVNEKQHAVGISCRQNLLCRHMVLVTDSISFRLGFVGAYKVTLAAWLLNFLVQQLN